MSSNITSQNPGQIKTAAAFTNHCGVDFSELDALDGLGKFNKSLFFASLLDFALGMLPGPMASIINSDTVLPQELPGIGAMLGASSMLLSPASAAPNLQGLWGMVSQNSASGFAEVSGSLSPTLSTFQSSLSKIPTASVSTDSIGLVSAAYAGVAGGQNPLDAKIQAGLNAACSPFGPASSSIFQAFDALMLLKQSAAGLGTPLTAAQRVFSSAQNTISTVENLAQFGISQQLANAGALGASLRLDQINSIANLSASSLNMCGPDVLRTLSALRQACSGVGDFYGTSGFGVVSWNTLTKDLATFIVASAIKDVAAFAENFAPFAPDKILLGIAGSLDKFISHALCQGGSDNLATAAGIDFNNSVNVGLTAVNTVATIYATTAAMSASFQSTLSVMQSFGSASAINSMVGGNFSGLFGLASGQVTNPKLALLRGWRSCLANSNADPAILAQVDERIKAEESRANTNWAMQIGLFDANGYFSKTKAIAKSDQKVSDAILQGKPVNIIPVTF